MLSQTMAKRLETQLNRELSASYTYLAMASYCHSINLEGFAAWFENQSREEREHGMRVYGYLLNQDISISFEALEAPKSQFESITDVLEVTLQHEMEITKSYNELYGFSREEKDYTTEIFLQWFITEQLEEEVSVKALLEKTRVVAANKDALLRIDRQVAKNTKSPADDSCC